MRLTLIIFRVYLVKIISILKYTRWIKILKYTLFTDKTSTFFTILLIFGFYNIDISKHKAFIGRSRTPVASKMGIFVKEANEGKLLIINKAYRLRCGRAFVVN